MVVIPAFEKQANHLELDSSLGSRVRLSPKFKHNKRNKIVIIT